MNAMPVVFLVPVSLAFLFGLLALADALERRSSVFLVRSSLRSSLSYEDTETVVAANLAPYLEAAGLGRETDESAEPSTPEGRIAAATAVVQAAEAAERAGTGAPPVVVGGPAASS